MPLYYFHLQRDGGRLDDEEGMRLPDREAAWYQAVRSARDLIRAERTIGCTFGSEVVEIEDERGIPVDRIPLEEIARFAGIT